jgi:hypothetical protein
MKYFAQTIAAAVVAFAAAPAFADQLAANAGLSPSEAQGLTLTQIAQVKFNRESDTDYRQAVIIVPGSSASYDQLAASAGLSPAEARGMTLDEIVVAKVNKESDTDDQQLVSGGNITMASRSPYSANSQFAASAGLSPSEAAGMSLTEIAAAKFARDTSTGDR